MVNRPICSKRHWASADDRHPSEAAAVLTPAKERPQPPPHPPIDAREGIRVTVLEIGEPASEDRIDGLNDLLETVRIRSPGPLPDRVLKLSQTLLARVTLPLLEVVTEEVEPTWRRGIDLFEGKKAHGNRELHITSSNFDEPQCLTLLRAARIVVTVHGEESDAEIVYLGGLHAAAMASVRDALELHGFEVCEHENLEIQGAFSTNICNIGRYGAGLQLELSRGLRTSFFRDLSGNGRKTPTTRLATFSDSVHDALRESGL
jgi:phage replication-related protein YjqB (UPF0714/DUF867 family)